VLNETREKLHSFSSFTILMAKCVPVIAVGMPGAVNTLDNLALDGVETEGTALGIHVKTRVGVLHRGLGSPGNIDAIKGAVEV